MDAIDDLTVDTLASAKGLDAAQLRSDFGLTDCRYMGQLAVRIPYRDTDGRHLFDKIRLADGTCRRAPAGGSYGLYGLPQLARTLVTQIVLLVEGESDVWAAVQHRILAVGVPGAHAWKREYAEALAGRKVVLWQEPGPAADQLVLDVARDLPSAWVVTAGDGEKDVCALHQRHGDDFRHALAATLIRSVPIVARTAALIAASPRPHRVPAHCHRLAATIEAIEFTLERARRRSTFEVLERRGFHLKGSGVNRTMRCPFPDHDDGNPSFSVNRETGAWLCFGCRRKGGDAIALVRQLDGLSFQDAVERVAG
jgi:DNA primase